LIACIFFDSKSWRNVIREKTIIGEGKSKPGFETYGGINDKKNPYHHINASKLDSVINKIREIVDK